jgi:hypothetical protein
MRLREAPADPALMRAALAMGQTTHPGGGSDPARAPAACPNDVPALRMLGRARRPHRARRGRVRLLAAASSSRPASSRRASSTR